MAQDELFEQLDFECNPLYEKVINDLIEQRFSIVEGFFTESEVAALRNSLMMAYEDDDFKKAAIGNRINEIVEKSVRGDFIKWLNEADCGIVEQQFFKRINELY